jgi:fermentation-respiration switch protein FrsA (DUF1100 family)
MAIKKAPILILLAFLLVGGMIVSPVCALGYEITAEPLGGQINALQGQVTSAVVDVSPDGDAVQRISVDVPTGTTVNFTLYYGSGSTVSGWMTYNNTGSFLQYSEVAIDSDVHGYEYVGIQEIGRIDIVGYARNWTSDTEYTTGFIVYDSVFGISERKAMAYYPVSSVSDNVIYKFEITSNNPVAVAYYTNTRANVGKAAVNTPLQAVNEWVTFAISIGGALFGFVIGLFGLIKFFFIDNLLLIIALWISVTMAYSAITSGGNVFRFYTKFFRYQRALLDFMVQLWNTLIQIISSFRGIFRI